MYKPVYANIRNPHSVPSPMYDETLLTHLLYKGHLPLLLSLMYTKHD